MLSRSSSLLAACALAASLFAAGSARAEPPPIAAVSAVEAKHPDSGPCTAAAASKPYPSGKVRLVIATGGTGGVFFPFGGGLARVLSARMPRAEVTAEVTGGSVDNAKLIFLDEADFALATADSAHDALSGSGAYGDTGPIPLCAIAGLYESFVHVVALDSGGLRSIADLKGGRVSVGSAGSSTEAVADRLLEAAGLDPRRDVTRESLSVAESVNAMKDRKLDAFFWIGGLPTASVTDLVSTSGLKIRFLSSAPYLPELRKKYGALYTAFTMPKASYAGLEEDVPGISIANVLMVNARMSERLVRDVLAALFDHLGEVRAIHPEARRLSLETASTTVALPFHPGAVAFYRERGVWKD